jgi:hypothetical protein
MRTRRRPRPTVADQTCETDGFSLIMRRLRRDRAIREIADVRCALREGGTTGAAGLVSVAGLLQRGVVRQLLVTARFVEREPGAALAAIQTATNQGIKTQIVAGGAAFELDLRGGGIGAVLRPRRMDPSRQRRRAQYAD